MLRAGKCCGMASEEPFKEKLPLEHRCCQEPWRVCCGGWAPAQVTLRVGKMAEK